jgi:hypothetical protein
MDTQASEWVHQNFNDLADEIKCLEVKHNYLVESISLLWSEVQRTSTDPLTRQLCERRIGELNLLRHDIDHKPENPTPTSGKTGWD